MLPMDEFEVRMEQMVQELESAPLAKNTQKIFVPGEMEWAKREKALAENLNPGSRRKSKVGKGIYLLEKCSGCAVLVECGFLSNRQEEALLRQKEYQKKLVCVIGAVTAANLS